MMFFGPLLLVGLVVLIIWFAQQQQQRDGPQAAPRQDEARALEIVRERYARGEISREEYQQVLRDLEQTR